MKGGSKISSKRVNLEKEKQNIQIDKFNKSKTFNILKDLNNISNREKNIETLMENHPYMNKEANQLIDKKVRKQCI